MYLVNGDHSYTLIKDGWIMFLVTWTKRKCGYMCLCSTYIYVWKLMSKATLKHFPYKVLTYVERLIKIWGVTLYSHNQLTKKCICPLWMDAVNCIQSHTCISKFMINWLPLQCFHNIELSMFMHHEALPLDTLSHAGRWAHMHTTSGAEQWSYTHREVRTIVHRSSSPVI